MWDGMGRDGTIFKIFSSHPIPSHEITCYSNIVLKTGFFAQLSIRLNRSGVLLLDVPSVADPAVRRTGDRRLLGIFLIFLLAEIRKKNGLCCFESRFLTIVAAPPINKHPLTDFRDSPLCYSS
jgi:hypothetical protein